MKDTPKGWPRISSAVYYNDAAAAIDWLCRVFGFELRMKVEGDEGSIEHSELVYGEGLIMVGSVGVRAARSPAFPCKSPLSLDGANTQSLCVCVDDADAHYAKTLAEGGKIVCEPETHDYGEDYWADRTYQAEDLESHQWWFLQRLRG